VTMPRPGRSKKGSVALRLLIVWMLTAVLVIGGTAGCGGSDTGDADSGSSSGGAYSDTLLIGQRLPPYQSLDPSAEGVRPIIQFSVYETLLTTDDSGEPLPGLAESWESNKDGDEWTFHLREGVKFHDGSELNAEAVKFSILRNKKEGMSGYMWDAVKSIDCPDDLTVVVTTKHPYPLTIPASSIYSAYIMSPAAVKKYGDKCFEPGSDAGSGPYTLESATQTEATLKRFDAYWGGWSGEHANAPALAVIRQMAEPAVRVQNLEQNVAAAVDSVPPLQVESLVSGNSQLAQHSGPINQMYFQFYNTKSGPCKDVNLRKALDASFPYEQVKKLVFAGYADLPHGNGPIQAGVPGFEEQKAAAPEKKQDLDKAREYLAQSAYPDGVKLVCRHIDGDNDSEQIDALWKAALQDLNIDLDVQKVQVSTLQEQAAGDNPPQDIMTTGWGPGANWAVDMYQCTYLPNFYNFTYWTSPETTKLINDAVTLYATDVDAAIENLMKCQAIIDEDCPATKVVDRMSTPVINKRLEGFSGFRPDSNGIFDFYNLALKE
jgi:peptide/nickel transport system substrate-binding protein